MKIRTAPHTRKDRNTLLLAAAQEKTQRHRRLPERYRVLRRLTAFHDDEVGLASRLRTRMLQVITELFPDYDRPSSFTFSKTGRVLLRERESGTYRGQGQKLPLPLAFLLTTAAGYAFLPRRASSHSTTSSIVTPSNSRSRSAV